MACASYQMSEVLTVEAISSALSILTDYSVWQSMTMWFYVIFITPLRKLMFPLHHKPWTPVRFRILSIFSDWCNSSNLDYQIFAKYKIARLK
jgi:hypothetical protein